MITVEEKDLLRRKGLVDENLIIIIFCERLLLANHPDWNASSAISFPSEDGV
jgi:hypothetical protein